MFLNTTDFHALTAERTNLETFMDEQVPFLLCCDLGVNKIVTRPVWSNGAWAPRSVMKLSSSFDHRVVDGWDAAQFIQRIKALLEDPALLFVP